MTSSFRRRLQMFSLATVFVLAAIVGVQQLAATPAVSVASSRTVEKASSAKVEQNAIRQTEASSDVLFAETFAVREGDQLRVNLRSERVEILPARGQEATVTVRGEGEDAARAFERSQFQARYRDGVMDVRTTPARGWRNSGDALTVTIEIPVQFSVMVDVAAGSVHVERIGGDLEIDSGSGSITVGTAKGQRIDLNTGSGSIRADVLAGDVTLDTGSGSIDVGRVRGTLSADTGSGSIDVQEADVSVFEADTGSGSVVAGLMREADIEVDTGAGRVRLTVPAASGADVDLSGRPIRIDDALGFTGERRRSEMRGQIGTGGPSMEISTGSGGIEILAR